MLNLSLSGCGFLGIYHIGVVSAFREHAPEFIKGEISGCSAGALVAVCVACDCCLGQMVSDVLEAALKARKYALGPLHPSFSIVDIVRNGLRRILPVDAHKICTNRVHISVTRWRDGKNFLISQFDSREELIQAMICSSFIPCYSGFIPPYLKGAYYWDGGLSNNNPILNADTILVSPFAGESDICPREETGAYCCTEFQGTNVQWSNENLYRISRALFPPSPTVLKAICFRGYKDAVNFLKSRNLLECSCDKFLGKKSTLFSVIGEDYADINELYENNQEESEMYDSDEDKVNQYDPESMKLTYKEMPMDVCEILDVACDDDQGFMSNITNSKISHALSIVFLPWTLPIEFSFTFTKRMLEMLPQIKVPKNSTNLTDILLTYLNFLIQKFTYDKYHYHARVTCSTCPTRTRSRSGTQIQILCRHQSDNKQIDGIAYSGNGGMAPPPRSNYPKICQRHRQPSVRDPSEHGEVALFDGPWRAKARTSRSSWSKAESTVDHNEFKMPSRVRRIKGNSISMSKMPKLLNTNSRQKSDNEDEDDEDLYHSITDSISKPSRRNREPSSESSGIHSLNRVHFRLTLSNDKLDRLLPHNESSEDLAPITRQTLQRPFNTFNLTDNEKSLQKQYENSTPGTSPFVSCSEMDSVGASTPARVTVKRSASASSDTRSKHVNLYEKQRSLDDSKNGMDNGCEDTYWDNLELNCLGSLNLNLN